MLVILISAKPEVPPGLPAAMPLAVPGRRLFTWVIVGPVKKL